MMKIITAIFPIAFLIWLIVKGIPWLEEREALHKKRLELKMREMESESEERILEKQEEHDNLHATTTIIGNLSVGGNTAVDKSLVMAQVKCVQCGGSIDHGAKFCKFCGTAVPDLTQKTELKIETVNKARIRREELGHELAKKKLEEETKQKKAEGRQQILWGILGVLLLVVLYFVAK